MPDQIDDAGEMMGQHSHASVDKRPVNGFRESACSKSAPNRRMCEKVDRASEANVRKPRRAEAKRFAFVDQGNDVRLGSECNRRCLAVIQSLGELRH